MQKITLSFHTTTKPTGGLVSFRLPTKMLNADCIYIRELKVQTTATPFLIKLRREGLNSQDLHFQDLNDDNVFISSGPQLNQIWHQQWEYPGLVIDSQYQNNSQAGNLVFRVLDENNADFAWTQLFIRFELHYREIPQEFDTQNWVQPAQSVMPNQGQLFNVGF